MNRETLSFVVPYTLHMNANGDFKATWESNDKLEYPDTLEGTSRSSGYKAVARLKEQLIEHGVISE